MKTRSGYLAPGVLGVVLSCALLFGNPTQAHASTDGEVWRYTIVGALGAGLVLFEKDNTLGAVPCTNKWWSIFDAKTGRKKVAYPIFKAGACSTAPDAKDWSAKETAVRKERILKEHGAIKKLALLKIERVGKKVPKFKPPAVDSCCEKISSSVLPHRRFRLLGKGVVVDLRVSGKYPTTSFAASGNLSAAKVLVRVSIKRGGKTIRADRQIRVESVPRSCNANCDYWPREGLTQAALTADGQALALVFDRIPFLVTKLGL